ncbi:DbpA RNA binding domain-containing protein, partial [Alistipes putredinis]
IDVDRKGKARIFLAFGARDGYDTRKTVRLLKQECGLSDHDIDDVRVMEDFSFATVPFDRAEKVVRALNKLSHGRPIAEISKDSPSARTSGGRQSHRRRESDTRSGRKTGRKPESRESYRQDSSVQEAFGAPDDRNGHRKSVRSPKTSGTKAGKKPATTVKASSKTSTPEKTAAKRASELPENWFEEWFGQRQPARNKKGPNRTPKRKNRD